MSDLLFFFGNNDDEVINNVTEISKNESYIYSKKSFKRPTTLRTQCNGLPNSNQNRYINRLVKTPSSFMGRIYDESPELDLPMLTSLSCSDLMNLPNVLPPENPKGNVEYKRQLLNLSQLRMQHLITQLKWRLEEGQGEAFYEIGVEDDGTVTGLKFDELEKSMNNLIFMAEALHASVTILGECIIGTKKAVEVLIRRLPTFYFAPEIKVAVLGSMDAGKSTLIGVLVHGDLDDGQGKTRLSTFHHIHEVRSGRTSSISCHLLGFDENHNVINYFWQRERLHHLSPEETVTSSQRLVSLIDLAGCGKYQRTTLFALTSRRPHYALLVMSASQGVKGTGTQHLQLAETLRLPVAVVVTKIDRCSPVEAIGQVRAWFQSVGRGIDVVVISSSQEAQKAAQSLALGQSSYVVPIFPVSCVNGHGIDLLKAFLGALVCGEPRTKVTNASEVWIQNLHWQVPRVYGCVAVGLVHSGTVYEHDTLFLGPQKDGHFVPVSVQSIHRHRMLHYEACQNNMAAFAITIRDRDHIQMEDSNSFTAISFPGNGTIDENDITIERGMVLLGQEPINGGVFTVMECVHDRDKCTGHVCWGVVVTEIEMMANDDGLLVCDLESHPWSWTVHCGNVYHKCDIVTDESSVMSHHLIQTLSSTKVIFRFKDHLPQFVHCDETFVFYKSHRHTKAHGRVALLLGDTNDSRVTHHSSSSSLDQYITAPSSPLPP